MRLKEKIDGLDHWPLMEKMLGAEVLPRKMYRSPLREGDQHPSFGFFRAQDGQARWKDFAMDNGDVYHLAMLLYRCDFRTALRKVAQVAGVLDGSPGKPSNIRLRILKIAEGSAECSYERRSFEDYDLQYWMGRYCIGPKLLEQHRIYPALAFRMRKLENGNVVKETTYTNRASNPMYVMEIGTAGRLKLYRPMSRSKKFRYIGNTNRNDVFGMESIRPGKPIVFCAGQKDAINAALWLDVNGLAFNSESSVPDTALMYRILMRTSAEEPCFVLYDNDNAGRSYAERLVRTYPMVRTIDLGAYTDLKDWSDVVELKLEDVIGRVRSAIS